MPIGKLTLPSGLQLIPTLFGYIISGRQPLKVETPVKALTILHSEKEKDIWDRHWALESSGTDEYSGSTCKELRQINEKYLQDFRNTIQRRYDGYYVRLPWKSNSDSLPDNKLIALKRLHKTLEIYAQKRDILSQYDSIFREQREKGIIEEVHEETVAKGTIIHYLPHQAVITPTKETTKMRIVFDASAHYKDKPCLNDVLYQGPLLLPDLVSILLRFRTHNIAMISDVEKAFLQVRLQEIDRDATRCLWVRNVSLPPDPDNIVTYRFTRVTFGLNTSPFLLGATIAFHLDHMSSNMNSAREIKENLYVDNLIIGARSSEETLDKYYISKEIFKGLNMNLREFLSNDGVFNNTIDSKDLTKATCPKVLGIPWNSISDKIILKGTMTATKIITKRTVSKQLASVFDPLGLMVPVLLPAKVFLQSLWKDEYSWDTPLAHHLQVQWRSIISEITTFYKEIERKVANCDEPHTMFVFTDASQFAMATCVYLSFEAGTNLIMAKSKLPSIKTAITVPKMEMNALTLGARVAHFAHTSLSKVIRIPRILFFTDSEIVLGWIKSPPNSQTVGVLVANRLKELRSIINNLEENGAITLFGHVPTMSNPADCATRGLTAAGCKEHIWWNGPQLMHGSITQILKENDMFPVTRQEDEVEDLDTENATTTLIALRKSEMEEPTLFHLSRFNNLHKVQRVVVYVLRFIRRLLQHLPSTRIDAILETIPALRTASLKHELTGLELREAKKCIIKDHQKAMVDEHRINSQKDLNIKPDHDGILRCYGRLEHAAILPSANTPIFIVPKTALARLIIWEAHLQYHQGVAHTMAIVRGSFWIPKLRQQVSQIIRSCLPCQKLNNLPFRYPDMEALPKARVQRTRPFEHVGLDYFGPMPILITKEDKSKAYGCIYTCRTTRLIHLELVENMTTEAFLNALRRIFARRGVPKTITCDNAPTFLLGEQILFDAIKRMLQSEKVESALARREIEWIHITPYAPWQGGFYERLIKSIKHSLYKALGKQTVTFDDLRTILTEIEAVLNSRPLTYQEEKWEQQPILRPIDFLQNEIVLDYPFEYPTKEVMIRHITLRKRHNSL
uniref:Integrase catalytic domain-containing protein n=1 Tax=Haemonchus contortus TaxID=6289 RepID=A0A7I4Y532_HAECO